MRHINGIEVYEVQVADTFATEAIVDNIGHGCSRVTFYSLQRSGTGSLSLYEAQIAVVMPTEQLKALTMQLISPPKEVAARGDTEASLH